jgi:hypothetical protein
VLFPHSIDFTPKSKEFDLMKKYAYLEGSKNMKSGIERTFDLVMNEASQFIPVW